MRSLVILLILVRVFAPAHFWEFATFAAVAFMASIAFAVAIGLLRVARWLIIPAALCLAAGMLLSP